MMTSARTALVLFSCWLAGAIVPAADNDPQPDFSLVPGVVIDHRPARSGLYIGSPTIAELPDGAYVAAHDFFGPKSVEHQSAISAVFRSEDRGATWKQVAQIDGAFWSNLFVHRGQLYLMGVNRHHGLIVIRRSDDGGRTWTVPENAESGLLTETGQFHTAPVPMAIHHGRLWRGFEDAAGGLVWGSRYRAMMLSAPVDADLLQRDSWTFSNHIARDPQWMDGRFLGWLEGNAVASPDGRMVNILRMHYGGQGGKAAIVRISDDGTTATFDPEAGFIDFPGGAKKFTIRFDAESKSYWSLVNPVMPVSRLQQRNAGSIRNTLALMRSRDLRQWEMRCILLHHADVAKHGFQYPDWQFDGNDLIAAIRTAYDDGLGGARNAHDANFLTFHRFANFRELTMADSVVDAQTLELPKAAKIDTGAMIIEGRGFALETLDNEAKAFGNRTYVWRQVPESLRGWRYTQTSGGELAEITVTAKRDSTLHIATAASLRGIDTRDWEPVEELVFHYTDTGRTPMQALQRPVKAGDRVEIPQGNWTGGILLIPPAPSD